MSRKRKNTNDNFATGRVTKNAKETKAFGKRLANRITGTRQKALGTSGAVVLALSGNLGSGKTTFTQGFAQGLGITQRILSPTFIIMRNYRIELQAKDSKLKEFFHVDLYRLEENIGDELTNLGIKEAWSDSGNIIAIEWAEKAKDVLPDDTIWVKFESVGEDKRRILVDTYSEK